MTDPTPRITPAQVADYLLEHPQFLHHNPRLLAALDLPKTLGENTVSLHSRQIQLVREENDRLNIQVNEFIQNAKHSEAIVRKLHALTLTLLAQRTAQDVPDAVMDSVAHVFGLQQVAIRVWGVLEPFTKLSCAAAVSEEVITFTDGLAQPYCGPNAGFSAVQWLPAIEVAPIKSVALLPLRNTPQSPAFGLVVLGSSDATRFTRLHDTTVLTLLSQVLSASLGRLLPE